MPLRRVRVLVLVTLVVVTLVACGGNEDETRPENDAGTSVGDAGEGGARGERGQGSAAANGTTGDESDPARSEAGRDWVELESAEGGYRVELPAEAVLNEQTVDVGGVMLDLSLYTAQADRTEVYTVAFVDYPESIVDVDPQLVLDGVVQGAAGNLAGAVASQSPAEVAGHPAVDFVIEIEEGTVQSRAVLVDRRLYLLQRAGQEPDAEGFARMVGSFELLEA